MRDLNNPLALSFFDGENPPNKSRARRKSIKRHNKAKKQHEKRMKSKSNKSNFGEARGIRTKTEDKKNNVYCKPGRQLDKSCAGAAKGGGYKESGRD